MTLTERPRGSGSDSPTGSGRARGSPHSSHSSSELSSSEGVWLVRKLEKMRENEKQWEVLKASHPKSFINEKKVSH